MPHFPRLAALIDAMARRIYDGPDTERPKPPVAHGLDCTLPDWPCDGCGPQLSAETFALAGPAPERSALSVTSAPYRYNHSGPVYRRTGTAWRIAGDEAVPWNGLRLTPDAVAMVRDVRVSPFYRFEDYHRPGESLQETIARIPSRPIASTPGGRAYYTEEWTLGDAIHTHEQREDDELTIGLHGPADPDPEPIPPNPTPEYLDAWENAEDAVAYSAGAHAAAIAPDARGRQAAAYRLAMDELSNDRRSGARRAMLVLAGYCGVPRAEALR